MRIRIKSGETNLNLLFPTRLIIGKTVIRLLTKYGRGYMAEAMPTIPPESLEILCAELRRVKKKYGSWDLVDVESSTGDIVQIVL